MADKKVSAVNLLPEYFKSLKNTKFLQSTIDQLIQKPELVSIDGYVGSQNTPTYKPTDYYISNGNPYQLDPALVIYNQLGNIQETQGYDDLINEIAANGGITNNLDRLLRTQFHSFNAHIDWDKLVNYQNYFWMPYGPETLEVPTTALDIENDIIGNVSAEIEVLKGDGTVEVVELSNGMMLTFGGLEIDDYYRNREFFVEGVGVSIKLIPYDSLIISETFLSPYPDGFDSTPHDELPYDNDRELPNLKTEYVTISRASEDLNPWSRYNRWVHKDVVRQSAMLNGLEPNLSTGRAQRPIIEFNANIKLFNFGSKGILPVDLMDSENADPFSTVEGSTEPVYIDGVLVENGHRVIFNATDLEGIRGRVYEVKYVIQQGLPTLTLMPTYEPVVEDSITVLLGDEFNGSEWWYDGTTWVYAQQKINLNQSPLFDLFDQDGNSYGDKNYYLSDFIGNKIFSYSEGSGTVDPYLGFAISYRKINLIGSILFDNNLCNDSIVVSQLSEPTYTISSNSAYIKINGQYKNAWTQGIDYPIPLLSSTATGILSYYEEPLSLTNNPLNGLTSQFTISELTEHVNSMVEKMPFASSIVALRDRSDYSKFGTTLISSNNPLAFAQMFIGKKEHNLITAVESAAEHYGNFKLAFTNKIQEITEQLTPVEAVDLILSDLNQDKVYENSYYMSDMIGYGAPEVTRSWTVTPLMLNNQSFPLSEDFSLSSLSNRAVYVYRNGEQLLHGQDYEFNVDTTTIDILVPLSVGDVIVANDYKDTTANYIPLTPSKLGLYPKFAPSIFVDSSYATPQTVIQGHDGSLTIAFGDYRDDILLELEKRIFNNIKSDYDNSLLDINIVTPNAFRTTEYSLNEINSILEGDFVRWSSRFGIDYVSNSSFDDTNSKTWNFYETQIDPLNISFSGSFRGLLLFLYGTDKPHIAPWEMLGIYEKPLWWESTYGPAPYTNGNLILWNDIEHGIVNGVENVLYQRPGLSDLLPVDEDGNLIDPTSLLSSITDANIKKSWEVGNVGPAEAAWRRSSYYPFAVQRLLALTKPADYSSQMYDLSRMKKNLAGQWTYGDNNSFLNFKDLCIYGESNTLTSGYSAFVSEIGKSRDSKYISSLRRDLTFADYRLFSKLNGYADKDTLQIVIDAYEPTSTAPGSVLPHQNYTLWFNKSNPLSSLAISGIIIQRVEGGYSVRGYDKQEAYFNIFKPLRNLGTAAITVGGISAKYVSWEPSGEAGGTNLSEADTTSASGAATGNFYQKGQYVEYNGSFYRTTVAHRAGNVFNTDYFQRVPKLPTTGGATVQIAVTFEQSITKVPYGTFYSNIQEVYDLIVGYGYWLESQGFVFNEYNSDLARTLDWNLSAEEFLFWSTQAWDNGSILTVSPFANSITLESNLSVVDNIFDRFYDYSILGANGGAFPRDSLTILRDRNTCLIQTNPETDGIYFARLNLVQKDHAIVFDNETIFGDVIYNNRTGNRQHRVKLVGFKTANWDGGLSSPGFIYDKGDYKDWAPNISYTISDVVRFNGNYYSANRNIDRSATFDFTKWNYLKDKPTAELLPNFDYKITQFEDFYSLDSKNFDAQQQKLAQHLTGYTPRVYLNNIFPDPVAQYKFYQGFIKEKGSKNAISKLAKISKSTLKGDLGYNEEWAFRVGHFGSFRTFNELETPLVEGTFLENPQIINFVSEVPPQNYKDLIHYVTEDNLTIVPENYNPQTIFATTTSTDSMLLQHSGYVRISDVTATAYNENSLLDIANSGQLKDGNTIWLGFTSSGDWDVYKYTYVPAEVVGVFVSNPLSAITFTTKYYHGLSVGEIIGINQLNSQVDGIYKVTEVNNLNQFTVSSELASIENAPLPAPGQLYVFKSVRTSTFDKLPSDKILFRADNGSKYWIDNDEYRGWEVYEKTNNFSSYNYFDLFKETNFAQAISKPKGSNVFVVGAPDNYNANQYGRMSLFEKQEDGIYRDIVKWRIGDDYTGIESGFGSSVVYDAYPFTNSKYGLVFAGAPLLNLIKISSINSRDLIEGSYQYVTSTDAGFGKFILVEKDTASKKVLVGSNSSVYQLTVKDTSGVLSSTTPVLLTSGTSINSLSGSDDLSVIAIGIDSSIKIYNKSLSLVQTIDIENKSSCVSPDGKYLFVGNPLIQNDDESYGQVYVYVKENNRFVLSHVLYNPAAGSDMTFGVSIDIANNNADLYISATGTNETLETTFDKGLMTLDGGITSIRGTELETGTVYSYYRTDVRFVYSQELTNEYVIENSGNNFGSVVAADTYEVIVNMPSASNSSLQPGFAIFNKIDQESQGLSKITSQDTFVDIQPINRIALIDTDKDKVVEYLDIFDPLKGRIPGIADQELSYKLVSDPAIYSIGVSGVNVDTNKNWLDDRVGELWWDLGTAKYQWYEQGDLEYRRNNWGKLFPGSTIDVYEWVGSTLLPSEWASQADTAAGLANGISGQPKFPDNSVISVKQIYDSISNSFTNVYYYWVKNKTVVPKLSRRRLSAYDVAAAIADPKAYGIKFAAIIDSDAIMLSNLGGVPVGSNISINVAWDTASQFVQSPKHTQWFILEEGSDVKMPPEYLETRMIDSILGHDKLGALIPNPSLSSRTKYGIGIRPQQTMFEDRHAALQNIIEFANDTLIKVPVNGYYSFKNLNAQEEIPDQYRNEYDHLVEDNVTLASIDTTGYERAVLNCSINNNGEVDNIVIANPGFGYGTINPVYNSLGNVIGYEGPTFTVDDALYATTFDNNTTTFDSGRTRFITRDEPNLFAEGLKIITVVNETGSIVQATIVNAGKRFGANFRLIARPHTVIVQSDDTYNGKWTRFEWDYVLLEWNRAHTQAFNTTLYWDFVDYQSSDYNKFQIYASVIGSPYELINEDLAEGQYVKINNSGDGNYIVLKKTADGIYGTYGDGYDLVYKQNGTIQFNDSLWKVKNNPLNWDYLNTYDQTLWDQTPDIELQYIFAALKNDLFIYELKKNWNLLFFKAVKYAMSEQKMLDWAFKTSFITLTHTLGELTQPAVYKLQDSSYYENYVEEVKPYHTQIRTFVTKYTVTEIEDAGTGLLTFANTDLTELERTSTIGIKFDRTSFENQVGDFEVVDTFVSNGIDKEFELSWVPEFDKIGITVKFNGVIALGSKWSINYTEGVYNGFHKKFANFVTLSEESLPEGTVVTVKYKKNANILNGTERVLAYYTSTYGVVGLDLGTLIEGYDYPGLTVGGRNEGPGFSNNYGGITPDSLISGGTWINGEKNTALGINPEDITISGEVGFINTFSGHAPSELLPGFVVESLGVGVYTVGRAQSPTMITFSYDFNASESIQEFVLPQTPISSDSIFVILNNDMLDYTTDPLVLGAEQFSIDWANQKISIPPQPTSGKLWGNIITVGGGTNNFGLIDHNLATVNGDTAIVFSHSLASTIADAFVTVNGVYTDNFTLDLSAYVNGPASVTVSGINSSITSTVQAYFFTESDTNFNRIYDQVTNTSTIELSSTGSYVVELIQNGQVEKLTTSQYSVVGTTMTIDPGIVMPGDSVKVITFVDNGIFGPEVEEFLGNISRRFIMSAPVANDYYVWVTIVRSDGTSYKLQNGIDFIILEDNLTIQVSDDWSIDNTDTIVVESFKTPEFKNNVLAYRMFKDMLGKTTYTRISADGTTYLSQPLNTNDTEIYVTDASVLTPPLVEENVPGVVFINAERIEFFEIDDNVLKQITRGTLGTGVNGYLETGTEVVDQGTNQEFDTSEQIDVQYTYTLTDQPYYVIRTTDTSVNVPNTTSTISSKGITLDDNFDFEDQVDVYLGGEKLRKSIEYIHDTTVVLDNIPFNSIKGSVSNASNLISVFAAPGDSYVTEDTGRIWTYTKTRTEDFSIPGWVYSGLTKTPPEFYIVKESGEQRIYLTGNIDEDIELAIVKITSDSNNDFNTVVNTVTTLSLWDSTTTIATFLKNGPTSLPQFYFSSPDSERILTDEQGNPLTNEDGQVLTGNI